MMELNDKTIELFGDKDSSTGIVMIADHESTEQVYEICKEGVNVPFQMLCISGMDWNGDLSPWQADAIFSKGKPFAGNADAFLKEITEEIIPAFVPKEQFAKQTWYLAGYSLAGLFALYAASKTDLFQGVISASGSLWYPGYLEYIEKNPFSSSIQKVYLSLGNRESRTKNPVMASVGEKHKKMYAYVKEHGIDTIFEYNEGNHFVDAEERLAKGIIWTLEGEDYAG